MRHVIIVFAGGGVGATLRAVLLEWLTPWSAVLPVPVLLANVLGAFLLAIVVVLADETGLVRAEMRLFLAVGVLGGFTTFSTFCWGEDLLIAKQAIGAALVYVGLSLILGVAAVVVGLAAGRELVVALERGAVALLARLDQRGLRRIRWPGVDMEPMETGDRDKTISYGDEKHELPG
jgi:CrcB protein